MAHPRQGFQTLELVVVLALCSLTVTLGTPHLLRFTASQRVRMAAAELQATLRLARSHAVRLQTRVAVKFRTRPGGEVTFTLYQDGDGDGVRNADIAAGIDPPIGGEQRLHHFGSRVRFGFPPGPAPRDPGDPHRRLGRLHDPIRFNRSDLASFGPLGTSTPGSLYFTDGRESLAVVRVLGRTGRVKLLVYDRQTRSWHSQ